MFIYWSARIIRIIRVIPQIYTTDVENRLKMHNLGRGAKYTRARRPCRLVYSKACDSKSSAMKLEYKIKQLSRKEKVDLILGVLKEL